MESQTYKMNIEKVNKRRQTMPKQNGKGSSLKICETVEDELDMFDECDFEVFQILHQQNEEQATTEHSHFQRDDWFEYVECFD